MRIERDDARIGLMVIVALLLFAGLLLHRSYRVISTRETRLKVRLASASEVLVGTEVQLQGYRVGQVDSIELERQGVEYTFLATLSIPRELALWRGTRAVVNSRIVGGSFLELQLPPVAERKQLLDPSQVLETDRSASLASLLDQIQSLVKHLDQGVMEVRTQFSRRGAGLLLDHPSIRKPLGTLDATLGEYHALAREGRSTLQEADGDLASARKSLALIQELLERRSTELDSIIVNLEATLRSLRTLSEHSDALIRQGGPEAEEALRTLNRDLKSAGELLELLKAKPSRVIWGRPSAKEQEAAKRKAEHPKE
nr:MlaD family protein [uncultured Holophaga sp.]